MVDQAAVASEADNTRPEEKELADKLMEELKAQGIDVDALNAVDSAKKEEPKKVEVKKEEPKKVEVAPEPVVPEPTSVSTPTPKVESEVPTATSEPAKVPATTPPVIATDSKPQTPIQPPAISPSPTIASTPTPMTSPSPTKPTMDTTSTSEVKKKGISLPKLKFPSFKFGKKEVTVAPETPKEKTETKEAIIQDLNDQIQNIKGDDLIVFKIRKQRLLLIMGLIIILLWMSPMLTILWEKIGDSKNLDLSWGQNLITKLSVLSKNQQIKSNEVGLIRIKYNQSSQDKIEKLTNVLKNNGFENIEVVEETQEEYQGINVITKVASEGVPQKLIKAIEDEFQVSSSSAELTTDSEVDGLITVGN